MWSTVYDLAKHLIWSAYDLKCNIVINLWSLIKGEISLELLCAMDQTRHHTLSIYIYYFLQQYPCKSISVKFFERYCVHNLVVYVCQSVSVYLLHTVHENFLFLQYNYIIKCNVMVVTIEMHYIISILCLLQQYYIVKWKSLWLYNTTIL